jgi:hypothetical protein
LEALRDARFTGSSIGPASARPVDHSTTLHERGEGANYCGDGFVGGYRTNTNPMISEAHPSAVGSISLGCRWTKLQLAAYPHSELASLELREARSLGSMFQVHQPHVRQQHVGL